MQIDRTQLVAELKAETSGLEAQIAVAKSLAATPLTSYIVELFTRRLTETRAFLAYLEAQPVSQVAAPPVATKGKSPRYVAVQSFFGAAKTAGLDAKNEDRSRGAVSLFVGRRIESRAELANHEWSICADAIRDGRLFW